MGKKFLCIIVPVRNNLELTKVFFESFLFNNYFDREEIKLLFVDDGSTDWTPEYLRELSFEYKWVEVLTHERSLGVCSSWNDGLRWASEKGADYIAILNNDIEFFSKGCLSDLVDILDSDPDIFWCSPETCYDKKKRMSKKGRHHFEQLLYSDSKTNYIVGCCFVIPKRAIEIIGYFDEQFSIRYYEDLDYINRILSAGKKLKMSLGTLIFHNRGSTSTKVIGGETNKELYDRKWKDSPYNILDKQPKTIKSKKHFNFEKGW